MGVVKKIILKRIDSKSANAFVKKWHYSGKVVSNSQLHFGAFLNNRLHGVLSYGPSINKKGTVNLVTGTKWDEFIELNRMALDNVLPKNSESRCLAISIKLIKKHIPRIKWIISFADATQSGDGAIYRATGFHLLQIRKNEALRVNPANGKPMHIIQSSHLSIPSREFRSWKALVGFQLKYVYFINKESKKHLTCDIIPYSKIKEMGIQMYKGERVCCN